MNTLSLFALIKPVFLFTFDRKRLAYLTAIPFCVLAVFSYLASRFPLWSLAETVEPDLQINVYMISASLFVFGYTFLALMHHTQRILFFGDGERTGRFFVPLPDKKLIRFLFVFIRIVCFSLFLSSLISIGFVLLCRFFKVFPEGNLFIFGGGIIMFAPYFMSRFIMKLSAQAADRMLGWLAAWTMVGRLTVMAMAMMAMFFIAPMALMSFLYGRLLELNLPVLMVLCNAGMIYSVLLACVLQSAFCGYMYSLLSSRS